MRDRPRGLSATAAALLLLPTLLAAASGQAGAAVPLPPTIEAPAWAVGFFWTYHFEGPTDQYVAGFRATYLNDTYTSEVVGEEGNARGDAWIVRNSHAGNMSGETGGIPISGTFRSLSFYSVRKSDLAVLNFTQDLNITALLPFSQTVEGRAHNESYADPPYVQIAFGAPADGTLWRVVTNVTSTGWFEIGTSPRINTSSYLALDYNLSVVGTEDAAVPAGTFASYNISGAGTADFNGTVYNFSEAFLFSPRVQGKVVDEAGYLLTSFYVNRPPAPSGLPPLVVPEGTSADLDLAGLFADPEGDLFTLSCAASPPLSCSVAPNGTLTVTAASGVNATLQVNITADDGLPGGNATYPLVVLVSGPGNPNAAPDWCGSPVLQMDEDADSTFAIAAYICDPDDASVNFSLDADAPLIVLGLNASHFTLHGPPNFFGESNITVFVYDAAGNSITRTILVMVAGVNDAPVLSAVGDTDLFVHTYHNVTAYAAASDVDGDAVWIDWTLDGAAPFTASNFFYESQSGDFGSHTLIAVAKDGALESAPVTFTIHVFVGPSLVFHSPAADTLRVANGSTLTFEINATDPDTATLDYTWSSGPQVLGGGPNATKLVLFIGQQGPISVLGVAADNGSFAGFAWNVIIEEAPPGLVTLVEPLEGALFDHNATAAVSASLDARLSNVTIGWRLEGAPFASTAAALTPPLQGPGNYTIELEVTGLYNDTAPYSTLLRANITVRAPAVGNNTSGNGNGNPPPPVASDSGPLLSIIIVVAAAALFYWFWRRSKRPYVPK